MNNVWILSLVSFFTDMGSYMVVPLVPILLASSGPVFIGIIDGVAESLTSVLKLWSGYASDHRKNHKRMAIWGYGLSGIGRIFLIIATSWLGVFVWKIVDRVGKGIRTAPRDALISEAGGKRQGRSFGLHQMMDMLGASIGIGIAYVMLIVVDQDNYRSIFIASLIPIIIGFSMLFKIKDRYKEDAKDNHKVTRSSIKSWNRFDRTTKRILLVILFFTFANSSNSFLLLRANELGVSTENTLLLYLAFHLIASLLSYFSGLISDRFGSRLILTAGYGLYGLIYFQFGFSSSLTELWLGFCLLGIYSALTKGVEKAVIARSAPSEMKATALGAYAMFTGIGLLPASLLMGVVWEVFGATVAFNLCGGIAVLTAILIYWVLSSQRKLEKCIN
ncbi:MFS transporter [Paenibacillus sp. SYP-B3998]|uniref:MFS transporter n=1 Tax=Paenibacillus sp. SYP-B3998 TaxID=2678564 RepID=A0A6G4A1F9_9BACL|nr:MFS transporter [Paenibacillus sp. SYP-B3998]NEW07661.1 MFS transporter [Paenibacillus sp. SYP-B3998]